MRITLASFVLMLYILVSGCQTVTEQDLAGLQSPNTITREQAIRRISSGRGFPLNLMDGLMRKSNEKEAIAIMLELLRIGTASKDTKLKIIKALGELGRRTEAPVAALIEHLKDKDPAICAQVVEALGKIKNRKAVPALIELLEQEIDVYPIIWALGEIRDPSAIPALNRLYVSGDAYTRYNAYRALAKIQARQIESQVGDSNTKGLLDLGKGAFKKYQDMMMVVFYKIAGLKRA